MFGVLKKNLGTDEKSAFVDAILLLIEEIVSQAVVADPGQFEEFKGKIEELRKGFEEAPDDPKDVVKAVARTLRQYNEGALQAFRSRNGDLHGIVAALTQAISSVAANGEQAMSRLQSIRKQFEVAASIENVRAAKARFAEHLQQAQEETLRQQTDLSDMVSGVIVEFKRMQDRANRPQEVIEKSVIYPPDALTGLPGRGYAEAILAEAHARFTPSYVTLFVVERLDVVTSRYGFSVADQMLLRFSQHLAQGLTNAHNLFRWGPSGFLSFIASPGRKEEIRQEVQRVAAARLDKTIEWGERTVLLPISCQHSFKPVVREIRPQELIGQLDAFVASVTR